MAKGENKKSATSSPWVELFRTFPATIRAVRTPLGLLALGLLVVAVVSLAFILRGGVGEWVQLLALVAFLAGVVIVVRELRNHPVTGIGSEQEADSSRKATDSTGSKEEIQALIAEGDRLRLAGQLYEALNKLTEARQRSTAEGWRGGEAASSVLSGVVHFHLGQLDQARQHYDKALPLYRAESDRLGEANTLKSLGDLERRLGQLDQARQQHDKALPLFRAESDRLGEANTLQSLGDLERHLGQLDQARQHYDKALPLYRAVSSRLGEANVTFSQAEMARDKGDKSQALQLFERAATLYGSAGVSEWRDMARRAAEALRR
jgi:tetratricopeptide (TPR) repeat protein